MDPRITAMTDYDYDDHDKQRGPRSPPTKLGPLKGPGPPMLTSCMQVPAGIIFASWKKTTWEHESYFTHTAAQRGTWFQGFQCLKGKIMSINEWRGALAPKILRFESNKYPQIAWNSIYRLGPSYFIESWRSPHNTLVPPNILNYISPQAILEAILVYTPPNFWGGCIPC